MHVKTASIGHRFLSRVTSTAASKKTPKQAPTRTKTGITQELLSAYAVNTTTNGERTTNVGQNNHQNERSGNFQPSLTYTSPQIAPTTAANSRIKNALVIRNSSLFPSRTQDVPTSYEQPHLPFRMASARQFTKFWLHIPQGKIGGGINHDDMLHPYWV
jgi:hypothetical protein